ncbi:hypothetical protein [Paenibacillus glycinis]|uniref:Uncharacterized protein n=1 Tax=Paenibacillus glycinis TaxID=2697035 RepID=A0ABW9XZN5_9BACL|nr:hypothetical protein [Paenibacillus glycinis]NBD28192.1 hypothetical protein [Paenibacillus glycinis]
MQLFCFFVFREFENRFDKSFSVSDKLVDYKSNLTIPYQAITILQNEKGFETIKNNVDYLDAQLENWKLANIEIQRKNDELEVYFKYSDSCGKPIRYDARHHYLSEKAFGLQRSEYGRITYNGRLGLQIVNLFNAHSHDKAVLTKRSPTKEYKQLEVLY